MSKKLFINFSAVNWEYINWSIIHKYITRLQQRIYTAAFQRKYAKMKQLQEKLLFSCHSKLLSVFTTSQNSILFQKSRNYHIMSHHKLIIAKYLNIHQSAYQIYVTSCIHFQAQHCYQQVLYTIIKHARQKLAELVFKPEWLAKCTRDLNKSIISNYSTKCKILTLLNSVHHDQYRYTLTLDLAMYITYGNYLGIISKLNSSSSLFLQQEIKVWLKKENLLAFKGRKFTHDNLSSYAALKNNSLPINILVSLLINELSSELVKQKSHSGIKYFLHNSQLIFLCKNAFLQHKLASYIKSWFISINTDARLVQLTLSNITNGFEYIGYIIQKKQRLVITASKRLQALLWQELSKTIQKSKSISSYKLIQKLSPKIAFWGQYFKYTKCQKVFSYLDYLLHLRIWTWILRRHSMTSKTYIKHKYFPPSKQYIYKERLVKSNWVLYGCVNTESGASQECFLVRFLWFKYFK